MHGMEYTVARERHQQLLEEAQSYRLQPQVGRWAERRRVVRRLAMVGGCLALVAAFAGVVGGQGGLW